MIGVFPYLAPGSPSPWDCRRCATMLLFAAAVGPRVPAVAGENCVPGGLGKNELEDRCRVSAQVLDRLPTMGRNEIDPNQRIRSRKFQLPKVPAKIR